jgi:LacI family transcriptional regulator
MSDVAREAGVSLMTVSRAINAKGEINPQTRARVLRVAEEMGYRPSDIARGLATRRTHTLGLVIPDVANPFFSDVARGAEHVAYAAGYNVFLCNTDEDPQRESAVLQSLEEKRVDGIVLCSSRLDDRELRTVVDRHPAVVLVNRELEETDAGDEADEYIREDTPSIRNGAGVVLVDDETGGRAVAQHLLQAGHKAVGLLAGPPASRSGHQRARGYRAALAAVGLPYRPDWVRDCSPVVESGQAVASALLAAHPELTALECYNDLVAVGALQACADLGRRVPDDVAIAGFDDIVLAALVTPPLTTCRVPRYELGALGLRLLLEQIGGCPQGHRKIVLRPDLVVRASAP